MTEKELSERHEILMLAQQMRPSPQCIALAVRQSEGPTKYVDIPVVSIASTGGNVSPLYGHMRSIMFQLEQAVMQALKHAHERMLALALDGKEKP